MCAGIDQKTLYPGTLDTFCGVLDFLIHTFALLPHLVICPYEKTFPIWLWSLCSVSLWRSSMDGLFVGWTVFETECKIRSIQRSQDSYFCLPCDKSQTERAPPLIAEPPGTLINM